MEDLNANNNIQKLYTSICSIINKARSNAYKAINFAMVVSYWSIGQQIVEDEQQGNTRAEYGKAVLKELSKKLTAERYITDELKQHEDEVLSAQTKVNELENHLVELGFSEYAQTKAEVENVLSYLKTKFFRALVAIRKQDQGSSKAVYYYVPLQDFSKPWSDEELYKKYDLTDNEIRFIEDNIKAMDGGDE